MKALAVNPKVKGSLKVMDVPKPVPGPSEALVRVVRVGLDGTDKEVGNALYGEAPKGSDYLIIGHESFGIVEEVGAKVSSVKPGDHVVATVRRPDGCMNCAAGESDFCMGGGYTERGIKGAHGYMCEYYTENEEYLIRIPYEIREQAVMLEPFSIVEKAVTQIFAIQGRMLWKPKTAMVFGTGVVGLLGAILLRQKGIEVTSIDRTDTNGIKDSVYREFGIRHVDSSSDGTDMQEEADIVLELTGNPTVSSAAMSRCGVNGICCLLSITGGSYVESTDVGKWNHDMVLNNKLVFGSVNSNKGHFLQGMNDMLAIEKAHPGALAKLITRRLKLDEFSSYEILADKRQLKTVVELGDDRWER